MNDHQGYQPIITRGCKLLPPPCCEDGLCPKCSTSLIPIAFDEHAQAAQKARQHDLAEALRAHAILQALYVAQGRLPSNLIMAMTYLHVEIVAGAASAESGSA